MLKEKNASRGIHHTAYRIFRGRRWLDFKRVRSAFSRSGIETSYEVYHSLMLFYSFSISLIVFLALTFSATFLPNYVPPLMSGQGIFLSLALIGVISLLFGLVTAGGFLFNILTKVSERKMRLDSLLYVTSSYFMVLSAGDTNPEKILKSAADEDPEIILSEEIQAIVSRMELLGLDIHSSLRSATEESSSNAYANFVRGLNTTIRTGASLKEYTVDVTRNSLANKRIKIEEFLESLGLIGEIYIILFVFFPQILTIMFSIMAMTGGTIGGFGVISLMYFVALVVIPTGGAGFMVLLDSIQTGVTLSEKKSLSKPKTRLYLLSIFIGLITFILALLLSSQPPTIASLLSRLSSQPITVKTVDDPLIVAIIFALIPLTIHFHRDESRKSSIDADLPLLARGISDAGMTGMTLNQAVEVSSNESRGPLKKEVEKLITDISWNVSIDDALQNFSLRCGTALSTQFALLLTAANKAGGEVKESLRLIGDYIEEASNIIVHMKTQMRSSIMVIYVSMAIFLIVEYLLATTLFPIMAQENTGLTMGSILIGGFNLEQVLDVTKYTVLIEAFIAGLAGGKMSTGSIKNGLKHVLIMVTITFVTVNMALGKV